MSNSTKVTDPNGFIGKEFQMRGFDLGRVKIRVIGYDSDLRMYLTRPLLRDTTGMRPGTIEALRMSPSMIQTRFQEIKLN